MSGREGGSPGRLPRIRIPPGALHEAHDRRLGSLLRAADGQLLLTRVLGAGPECRGILVPAR